MSALNRRRATLIGVSGLSLAVAGVVAPGAFAAETVDGNVKISNTETVQVQMGPSGSIDAQRVYEQLVLTGKGKVDVSNPVSTKGLRNLDGFGGFDVRDGKARIKTSVDGTKKYRSVSDFTKKLPLDIKITYLLDGKKMSPSDIVGKSGELEVRYVVTNVTGTNEDVTYKDGNGQDTSSPEDVVIPMVGTLETTLPSSFTKVVPDGANAAGDGRGGTLLSFTMTLIPPIGKATAEIGYKAKVKNAVIPTASISALPVNPLENVSFKGGAESYAGGAETGQDLTAGATEIDSNLLKIRDGASDLVAGILKLKDGADQLSTGLQDEAAPGAKKLAAGADKLDAGAKKLAGGTGELSAGASKLKTGAGSLSDGTSKLSAGATKLNQGAGDLSDGLKTAASGAPALLTGVAQLKAGAQQVDAGLATLQSSVSAGIGAPGSNDTLRNGVAQLIGALGSSGPIQQGLSGVSGALTSAESALSSLPDSPQKTGALQYIAGAKGGITSVVGGITSQVLPGLNGLDGGLQTLNGKVAVGVGSAGSTVPGNPATPSLRNGTAQLIGGLTQLQTKGGELVTGLDKLSAGAGQLKAGTGDLSKGAGDLNTGAGQLAAGTGDLKSGADKLNAGADTLKGGTGQLSKGAGDLADGLVTAADGSGKLAAGLGQAAESAPALPAGATQLSEQGTSQIVAKGDATAKDFGLRYALLEAGAARAATAQPYGSPEGATALTAFKFEIAGSDGADSANLRRGVAAVVLLGMAGLLATIRRRGII